MHRMHDFNNLDLFSYPDLEVSGAISPDFTKPAAPTTLPEGDWQCDQEQFYMKSTENLAASYGISFEKDFMKEHKAVFEKILQNLMESFGILKNYQVTSMIAEYSQKEFKEITPHICEDLLQQGQFKLEEKKAFALLQQLLEYDKFSEFLDIVVTKAPEIIVDVLLEIAFILVGKYNEKKFEGLNDSDLLELASKQARSLKLDELISVKGICLSGSKETTESTRKFMEAYCATILLVIAQYFENPFSDCEAGGLKRPLSPWSLEDSEQEENFQPTPRKQRKFSF